ncbi:competence protein ComE [Bacillus nakamurai]|uniref:Competence protein ComE n=1 Tax=Bacillus nakamurai TaxID=1793963 RepID=A0A150F8F3_9BACI|nr:helix-hairpin-helix domain-containing protein [Bacillus nakamurai]KXZ18434.1 competence protein ComE [Bacillus nakamurai]KXZ23145.1 competence protein ComE [Bacillus nakamurai]MCC9023579.1 helix-hairpin-helix domain-containing protein [Bacillus nakamurai]MED1229538.1 helix-hairpin-helix domain-containing protein [Bacillus nakamurai]
MTKAIVSEWMRRHMKILAACSAVLLIIVCFLIFRPEKEEPVKQPSVFEETASASAQRKKDPEAETIMIDIKGAVRKPGVYEMKQGDRVTQAIEKAGGMNEKADEKNINLAEQLQDGTIVYIPSEGEEENEPKKAAGTKADAPVNINTASLDELQTISGVGQKKAEAIIAYREENGRFQTAEDIMNVSGIGEKSFERIKASITVK